MSLPLRQTTHRLPSILSAPPRPSIYTVSQTTTTPTPSTSSLHAIPLFRTNLSPSALSSRPASSASTRWKTRQSSDPYTRASKLAGLKSRAAFKLLEIDSRHRLFRAGATVVDLGYAPGSWSQVAVSHVQPGGRVVGIDLIPAQPPRGVNALQGDFLRPDTRDRLREFLRDPARGRVRDEAAVAMALGAGPGPGSGVGSGSRDRRVEEEVKGGVEGLKGDGGAARGGADGGELDGTTGLRKDVEADGRAKLDDLHADRVVDVVLSDMSAPWPLASQSWVKSVSNPYLRMMNTSGMAFRDHAGSMDLCLAALDFCYHTLVTGGHFLCKFYAGAEDHALELRLKRLFDKVHRIKPDSSRKESKEAYFVALRRKDGVAKEAVFEDT